MSSTKREWHSSSQVGARPIGRGLSILEFQDEQGEWQCFDILLTPQGECGRVLFGGYCNVGFLESGYIERDSAESLDETLQELLSELETYYNQGPEWTNRIVFNERM